jgi:glucokinase
MNPYSIGVDLGGTNLRVAAYTPSEGLGYRVSVRTALEAGPEVVVRDMCNAIHQVLSNQKALSSPVGICIASPGPLELPIGRLHTPPNLPGWDGFNLRDAVEQHLSMPVRLENDANAAALAECHLGSGRDLNLDNLCMITLGTGVGNAIVSGGKIVHGSNGLAGEAGHAAVWPDGPPCTCGNSGCLELYASATGVRRLALEKMEEGKTSAIAALYRANPEFTSGDLYKIAQNGAPDARAVFDHVGSALGISIANLVNILNPALVVIAGGVSDAWPFFSPRLFEELRRRSFIYRLTTSGSRFQKSTVVRQAMLGAEAGLVGAGLHSFVYSDTPSNETLTSY